MGKKIVGMPFFAIFFSHNRETICWCD